MAIPITEHRPQNLGEIAFCYPASLANLQDELIVEIGPGRGDFLFYLAVQNPKTTVVGIEIKPRRFDKLVIRREKQGLKNLYLIQADAREALKHFAPESVKGVYVNFPDPWPKRRHLKNRLLNEDFVKSCSKILVKNGSLFIATDADWYAEDLKKTTEKINTLRYSDENYDVYPTLFAKKWLSQGRSLHCQRWTK